MDKKDELIFKKIDDYANKADCDIFSILRNIRLIIRKIQEDENIYFYIDLINCSEKIRTILSEFVNSNIYSVKNGEYNDSIIIPFIRAYTIINNISIKEYDTLDDNDSTDNIVKMYLKDIQLPLLTADEEKELARKIKLGDMVAKNLLIEHNLRLVVSIAKKNLGYGIPILDLIQDGNIGLMKAALKFEPDRGVRFSTYAYDWVQSEIKRGVIYICRNIRVPENIYYELKKFQRIFNSIAQDGKVDLQKIADMMNISIEEARVLSIVFEDTISFSQNINKPFKASKMGKKVELGSMINSGYDLFDEVVKLVLPDEIAKLFDICGLSEKQKEVMILNFGLDGERPLTFPKIAAMRGTSKQSVQQSFALAMKKIRDCDYTKEFLIYLDNPNECAYYKKDGTFNYEAYEKRLKRIKESV